MPARATTGATASATASATARDVTRFVPVAASVVVFLAGIALVVAVQRSGTATAVVAVGGVLRADALAAYLLAVVGAVALTATWGAGFNEPADGRYAALVVAFLAAMSLAVLADNLGVAWVAVEATTIATAFLVGRHGGKAALEAAWKYVVLGSVGVAIAFLGIVLLYAATVAAGQPTLSWVELTTDAPRLDPDLTRLALGLAALGLATKAGLAPMHSWLPDAHSQAPAPVSGLMSGVLLAVAFSVILRVKAISDAVLGVGFMRGLLVVAALLSLLVAGVFILSQRDYKRMLAYSSIEHMGLLALGAAAGSPLAIAAVLLHVLGHGLAKASLFVIAGRMLHVEGSARIADVRLLLRRRPGLAVPLLAGTVALLGLPPFGLIFTEIAIVLAAWQQGLGWAALVALALVLLVVAGFGRHVLAMTVGAPTGAGVAEPPDPALHGPGTPIHLALGVTCLIGVAAWPLAGVLSAAAAVVAVTP